MSKGAQTRQRIIEIAAPLFNQGGFAGCSVGDIMEATGLRKGGIYRYFETKEDLAAAALSFSIAQSRKIHLEDLDSIPTALGQLRYAIDRFLTEPSAIKGGCPLLNAAVDSDDGNALLRDLTRKAFADWRHRLCAIARKAIRSHELRPGIRPEQLANTIIASLEGALMLSRLEGNDIPLQHIRQSLKLLLDTLSSAT